MKQNADFRDETDVLNRITKVLEMERQVRTEAAVEYKINKGGT